MCPCACVCLSVCVPVCVCASEREGERGRGQEWDTSWGLEVATATTLPQELIVFTADVFEGRWGSVATATGQLLLVERILRSAWSLQRFSFGGKGQDRDDDEHATNTRTIDDAIQSKKFWAMAFVIDRISETLDNVMAWAESCPCHRRSDAGFQGPSRHHPRAKLARAYRLRKAGRCPLAGMRAPELAVGALPVFMRRLWETSHASLLLHRFVVELDPNERKAAMASFTKARRHVQFYFNVKAEPTPPHPHHAPPTYQVLGPSTHPMWRWHRHPCGDRGDSGIWVADVGSGEAEWAHSRRHFGVNCHGSSAGQHTTIWLLQGPAPQDRQICGRLQATLRGSITLFACCVGPTQSDVCSSQRSMQAKIWKRCPYWRQQWQR